MGKYVNNSKTIAAYLAGEFGVAEVMREKAEKVLSNAQSSAPVASGAYKDSLHIETVKHPTRLVTRVVADVPYALNVEANTGNLTRSLG